MLLTKLQWTIAAFCDQHLCYNGIMIIHLSEYYYQASNPYIGKLSILDDELALNGFGCVISAALTDYNRYLSLRIYGISLLIFLLW